MTPPPFHETDLKLQHEYDELQQQKANLERNIKQLGDEKSELMETLESHTETLQMLQERLQNAHSDIEELCVELERAMMERELARRMAEEEEERKRLEEEDRKYMEERERKKQQELQVHAELERKYSNISNTSTTTTQSTNKSIDPLWADRFSTDNSLQREYDSLLMKRDAILQDQGKLMEENEGLKQKLISQHEVLKMMRTRIITARKDVDELCEEIDMVRWQKANISKKEANSQKEEANSHNDDSTLSIEYIMSHEDDFSNPQQVIKILKDHIRKLTSHK
ncbi:hypothetical protein C9374_007283 [Naegleria lovaniensis]|uniref:Uncharacterized protein n=1 Tax=Naegleria lovaniensis TaxID=51637 RepID=A0AA88H792_NAELO|nr:uncharacterized protein C9374_007283 [Naegleria lovaniensis]KAG2393752.1 hypothetical protein C9374_007283 [Naegleria lovaniensis]